MPNSPSFALRGLQTEDLAAAHALSQAVHWPHRLEDWQLMLRLGRGHVATDSTGTVRGVAMWWTQGEDFATLGMVIVAPDLQRSGIGRRLMTAILAETGSRRVQLIATREGMRLYEGAGFVLKGEIRQHHGVLAAGSMPVISDALVRALAPEDWPAVCGLDAEASGADRSTLLDILRDLSIGFVAVRNDRIVGYALRRDFGRGRVVGPLVADTEATALALLSTAMVDGGGFLRTDIPADASRLARWLDEAGLPQVGDGRVMLRGTYAFANAGPRIFGLASQALG